MSTVRSLKSYSTERPSTMTGLTPLRPVLLLSLVASLSVPSFAQSEEDQMLGLSRLSASALQCSLLASVPDERDRLLGLGVSAGRAYLVMAQSKQEVFQRIWQKIPGTHLRTSGPSLDFLIGRAYGIIEAEIERGEFSTAQSGVALKRSQQFAERNCALLK